MPMIRSLRYVDFVRIAKTERVERKQGERGRERGRERDGRVAGNRFSIKRAVYPSLGSYRLVDTLADRRQLIKENSETICSREYPECRFLAVDF